MCDANDLDNYGDNMEASCEEQDRCERAEVEKMKPSYAAFQKWIEGSGADFDPTRDENDDFNDHNAADAFDGFDAAWEQQAVKIESLQAELTAATNLMDSVRDLARNRNPKGATILDFMACWNEQYEAKIAGPQAVVKELPEMADGTKVTGDLVGRVVWTWGFPCMCLSSFTVKQIRFDGESWEFVGTDGRYMEQVAMLTELCCLSEESAAAARKAKEGVDS